VHPIGIGEWLVNFSPCTPLQGHRVALYRRVVARPRIFERESELATLASLVSAAREGRGGVAVIEGEAGVGKSTLLAAARSRACDAGLKVLAGRGSQLERDVAFGVARQLVDRLETTAAPALRALDDPQNAGYAVIQRLFRSVVAHRADHASSGILLTVDDAQWADEQSLRFVAHVALRIDELPIALVVAVRTGEPAAPEHLLEVLHESADATVLAPRRLTRRGVAELVKDVLGDAVDAELQEACARASGGNPFYLRELLNVLAAESGDLSPDQVQRLAPPRVLRSVMVRLGRLGRDATQLARALVILGDGAPLALVARLADLERRPAETAADALAAARIWSAGEPLAFTHPVIAAALASDMGHFDRCRAHGRAARMLLADGADTEHVAAHLLRAPVEDDPRVVPVLEQAAASALAAGAPKEAARLLHRALEEPLADTDRPRLMLAAAKAEAHAGSQTSVMRLEETIALLEPGEPRANGIAELAMALHHRGRFDRAFELARRAREELPADHPGQERLLATEIGASLLHPATRPGAPATLAPLVAAVRSGRPPTDPSLLAVLAGWMGVDERPATVCALAQAAVARDPLIDGSHGASVGWVASALIWTDQLEFAERWLGEVLEVAAQRGAVMTCAVAALNRATARLFMGSLSAAVDDAERALDVYRYGWTTSPWSTPVLVATHVAQGDLDAARTALAIGERAGAQAFDHELLVEARCRLHLAAGDAARALDDACATGERLAARHSEEQPRLWAWRRLAATAAHRLGQRAEARELIGEELATLRQIGPARPLGEALTVAGVVTGGVDGLDLLAEAVAVLEASPAQLQLAESLFELGGALRRANHRIDARAPLYQALELADRFGAHPLARRVRDELAVLGARPRRAALSGPASLTTAERRVVDRAANGLTTPQIARELYVSVKTVESHLGRAYRKLGVTRRTDLSAALEQR
jgi:DNA-binding CsgD family transcriptional regulator